MQTPAFPGLQARYRSFTNRGPQHEPQSAASRYLQTHAVGGIVRGLFMSSLLWMLIAFTVYTVYSMIVGTH